MGTHPKWRHCAAGLRVWRLAWALPRALPAQQGLRHAACAVRRFGFGFAYGRYELLYEYGVLLLAGAPDAGVAADPAKAAEVLEEAVSPGLGKRVIAPCFSRLLASPRNLCTGRSGWTWCQPVLCLGPFAAGLCGRDVAMDRSSGRGLGTGPSWALFWQLDGPVPPHHANVGHATSHWVTLGHIPSAG